MTLLLTVLALAGGGIAAGWGVTGALIHLLRVLDTPQDRYRARLHAHPAHTHPGHRGLCHGGPGCPDRTP